MKSRRKFFIFWKLVQREKAVRYMMTSLFSFVATVSVVRSYLILTGFPQIGSGTLHIAHVLWGGLILYIAAILPLIYLNPRVLNIGAILSGVGMGLFIDEVGKFITREYDYFFPAAAPIIYTFFLLLVILVTMIRRPKSIDGRAELIQSLEIVREQLYRPLDPAEREHIERDMSKVIDSDPDTLHQDMARRLLEVIHSDRRTAPELRPAWWMRFGKELEFWLTERRLSWFLGVGMVVLSMITLKNPLQVYLEHNIPNSALVAYLTIHAGREITPADALVLFNIRLVLEILVGILLLVSVGLLAAGKRRSAFNLGYLCLLISLVVLDLILFYFEQFSTVLVVGFQIMLIFGVMYYRRKYMSET